MESFEDLGKKMVIRVVLISKEDLWAKRSRSLFDISPRNYDKFTISNISLKANKPIVTIFHM